MKIVYIFSYHLDGHKALSELWH